MAPPARVMVASVPVTPGPAVTGPGTGGQIWAQVPLQLDAVLVSGANEYRVRPWALVSTVAPLIVAVLTALADAEDAAGLGAASCPAAAVPQPAASTARSASPTAGRVRVIDMKCPSVVIAGVPAVVFLDAIRAAWPGRFGRIAPRLLRTFWMFAEGSAGGDRFTGMGSRPSLSFRFANVCSERPGRPGLPAASRLPNDRQGVLKGH